jgi:CheY-like chemotaxis protein
VLWVDDHPENNRAETRLLEAFGLVVVPVLNTRQALVQLKSRSFVAVISDMARSEGPNEGYVLLDVLRRSGIQTPFFVYAGSREPAHVAETLRRGGQGCTDEMHALVELVRSAS